AELISGWGRWLHRLVRRIVWQHHQLMPAGMLGPIGRYAVMSVMILSSMLIQPKPPTRTYSTRGSLLWGTGREVSFQWKVPVTNTNPSFGTLGCTSVKRLCGQESIKDGFTSLPIAIQFCIRLSCTLESLAVLTLSQNSPQCSQDVTT